jgi:hypothetical protein
MEADDIPATESVAGETSEPNFDEDVIRAEKEYPVDVAANFGGFSGLDKGGERAKGGGSEGGGSEVVEREICGASSEVGGGRSGIVNPTSQRSSSGPRPRSP